MMIPTITDEHINEIEKELLPKGCSFNPERRTFIKCIGSRDVNACAGSGKTTALIAKLMILDKYFMPFPQNKGVCVLTHTNVAIDEIKEKLGASSKLLNYPNFFGTIQAFVDKFLAVPYYVQCYKDKPKRIDNDIYIERLANKLTFCLKGYNKDIFNKILHLKNVNPGSLYDYRFDFDGIGNLILVKGFKESALEIKKPQGRTKKENYTDWNDTEKQGVWNYLIQLKKELLKDGILHFDDAYFLAERYLSKYETQLKNLFSNRFQFVFIDEMQDSYQHQIDIFKKIFDDQRIICQCIGDPNQAIFNAVTDGCAWEPNNALPISDSQRFSTTIANAIQNVRLNTTDASGNVLSLNGNANRQVLKEDNTKEQIKPYIIVFEDTQIKEVIPKFKDLILEHKLHIPETTGQKPDKIKFKAIGWVGQDKDETTSSGQIKHVIKHYFEENSYKKESKTKETFDNLADYILKQEIPENEKGEKQYQTSKVYKDALTNAFLKVLRTVGKKQDDGKYYTSTSFWQKVYADKEFADKFLPKMASWIKSIVQGDNVISDVQAFICNELKDFFAYQCNQELTTFFNNPPKLQAANNQKPKNYLEYESDNVKFKIDIATIHSIKGETHTGTLYLETFKDNFETRKGVFKDCLTKKENRNNMGIQLKETLKMAYVGMSRPTHLLCVAIHKSSLSDFEQDKEDLENAGWQVIPLTAPTTKQ